MAKVIDTVFEKLKSYTVDPEEHKTEEEQRAAIALFILDCLNSLKYGIKIDPEDFITINTPEGTAEEMYNHHFLAEASEAVDIPFTMAHDVNHTQPLLKQLRKRIENKLTLTNE